jgi:predicted ester cyclase
MTTDIRRVASRILLEVINEGNFDLLDELLAPDFVDHTPRRGVPPTRAGLKQAITELEGAFPDVRYAIDDAFTCGDLVVHRLSATGTMTGTFMGIPATGKPATWSEIHIGRVVDGRLTEHWGLVDQLGMLVQLGIVPEPGRVPATA